MKIVSSQSGATVLQFAQLREELFRPKDPTNKRTKDRLVELAKVAADAIVRELEDEKKASRKYLSIDGSSHSWAGCSTEAKEKLLGREATNDRSESALGGATYQIQQYGRIGIPNAAAVSDMKRNGYFKRFCKKGKSSKGMFHQFDRKLRDCLLTVALEDRPATMAVDSEALERQRECKRVKEEILREKGLAKAQEGLLEASYYHRMYHSDACWKGRVGIVDKNLKRIPTKSGRLNALKENIKMRVVGLGWDQFAVAWSEKVGNKRRLKSVKELADELKKIIKAEKKLKIPKEPDITVPSRPNLPVCGTSTKQREDGSAKDVIDEDKFRRDTEMLRREREAKGEGSLYSVLQPFYMPHLSELKGRRIDVLTSFELKSKKKELRWCQGEVVDVVAGTKKPTVLVDWDEMIDVDGKAGEAVRSKQVLLPSKWNKDFEGSWRLDVGIRVGDDDEGEEGESIAISENVDFSDNDTGDDDEGSSDINSGSSEDWDENGDGSVD